MFNFAQVSCIVHLMQLLPQNWTSTCILAIMYIFFAKCCQFIHEKKIWVFHQKGAIYLHDVYERKYANFEQSVFFIVGNRN